jgi:pilus assembly protein Flp/PilA
LLYFGSPQEASRPKLPTDVDPIGEVDLLTSSQWASINIKNGDFSERPLRLVIRFLKDENAATAIEYGLIAAGVALAIITVIKGVGTKLNTTFSSISSQLN